MPDQATPTSNPTEDQIAARIAKAAQRAKAEAEERRTQKDKADDKTQLPPELGGPKGPEPTRYGDWERKGIVSDF
jgi:hypothetical protein